MLISWTADFGYPMSRVDELNRYNSFRNRLRGSSNKDIKETQELHKVESNIFLEEKCSVGYDRDHPKNSCRDKIFKKAEEKNFDVSTQLLNSSVVCRLRA